MMSILTLVIIPLIIALITLLLEYWLIQPLREKKAKSRLINNIQEVPPQQYLQSNNRILRLPSKNIAVITTVDTRIFDLSDFPESVDFKGLIPLLVDIFNLEKNLKNSYVVSTYYLYANWKRTKHDVSVSQSISENPVLVLSSYPCFELLQASDMLQDGLITSTLHKPLSDSREARLEYDYRSVLDLDRLSNKVKLISVKNDKTL